MGALSHPNGSLSESIPSPLGSAELSSQIPFHGKHSLVME